MTNKNQKRIGCVLGNKNKRDGTKRSNGEKMLKFIKIDIMKFLSFFNNFDIGWITTKKGDKIKRGHHWCQ